jgi:hypothetical protein
MATRAQLPKKTARSATSEWGRATPESKANGFASQKSDPRMGSLDAASESEGFAG